MSGLHSPSSVPHTHVHAGPPHYLKSEDGPVLHSFRADPGDIGNTPEEDIDVSVEKRGEPDGPWPPAVLLVTGPLSECSLIPAERPQPWQRWAPTETSSAI